MKLLPGGEAEEELGRCRAGRVSGSLSFLSDFFSSSCPTVFSLAK